MASLVKKAVKKVLKAAGVTKSKGDAKEKVEVHVHYHHSQSPTDEDPKPKKKAQKCPTCRGKGTVTKWEHPPYARAGYWTSVCHECEGKKYIVVYDFDE